MAEETNWELEARKSQLQLLITEEQWHNERLQNIFFKKPLLENEIKKIKDSQTKRNRNN